MIDVKALVAFLNARLDEDQAHAEAASWEHPTGDPWSVRRGTKPYERPLLVVDHLGDGVVDVNPENADADGVAEHIARHDPARQIREVAAKRRHIAHWEHMNALVHADERAGFGLGSVIGRGSVIYNEIVSVRAAYARVLQDDAAVYSQHPDYQPEWAPSPIEDS